MKLHFIKALSHVRGETKPWPGQNLCPLKIICFESYGSQIVASQNYSSILSVLRQGFILGPIKWFKEWCELFKGPSGMWPLLVPMFVYLLHRQRLSRSNLALPCIQNTKHLLIG